MDGPVGCVRGRLHRSLHCGWQSSSSSFALSYLLTLENEEWRASSQLSPWVRPSRVQSRPFSFRSRMRDLLHSRRKQKKNGRKENKKKKKFLPLGSVTHSYISTSFPPVLSRSPFLRRWGTVIHPAFFIRYSRRSCFFSPLLLLLFFSLYYCILYGPLCVCVYE